MMRSLSAARFASLLVCLMGCGPVLAAPPVLLTSGLKITRSSAVKPGVYTLSDSGTGILQISGSDFTVEMRGAKLIGPGTGKGIGIHITDSHNVTLKNADV